MTFAIDWRRVGLALLAVTTTAALVWFGTGLFPMWPLLWFAPLPLLLFALRGTWWSAAATALLAWLLGDLNLWHYFSAALHVPLAVRAEIVATPAVVIALAVLLFRALALRGAWWSALVAFPSAWVSFEYIFNLTSPHGTAASLSYSQLNFLTVLQLASVTGPWGISFLVLLFPAGLAIFLHRVDTEPKPKEAIRIMMAIVCVMMLVLTYGSWRSLGPSQGQKVRVGLVASDLPANQGVASAGAQTEGLLRDYAAQAETLAARGAQVIVLPEHLGEVVDPNTGSADAIFQSLADKTGATIVVGVSHVSPPTAYNQARVYAPGAQVLSYDKHHLLPPFESRFKPGTSLTLMPENSGTWGVAICKDFDFTQLSRQYGNAGAGLMLAPAWDFVLDRFYHGHMAVMRGVESGFSIARAARGGFLTVSDDRGRILAETRSDSAPFATLLADAPAGHDDTVYLLLGDWFAWLVLAVLVFTIAMLFRNESLDA
ncbi:MAG: nitrilase-related carbon-nitrogen hydrolase [Terracidiphilus sp.]|jgi:apolipoprotein N-acyltransferase